MGDDRVTIDPEFRPPPPGPEQPTRRSQWIAVGLVAVALVLVFGWVFAAPTETDEAVVAPTTTIVEEPATTAFAWPTTSMPPTMPAFAAFDAPLAEQVPGFTDTIVMLATPPTDFRIVRWPARSPSAEVALSLDRDGEGWGSGMPSGLDASGHWFAELSDDGLLAVHDTSVPAGEPELIDVRVVASLWHDTEPGRIAWLACSRAGDSGTLLSLDLEAEQVEPVALGTVEEHCGEAWPWHWGQRGLVLAYPFFSDARWLYSEGSAKPFDRDAEFVAIAPDGTTMWMGTDEAAEVFLVAPDGRGRSEVPGIDLDDTPVSALWSPDGSRIALFLDTPDLSLRIVETGTGRILGSIVDAGIELLGGAWAWSTDGRFLLFQRGHRGGWELAFYDTETQIATAVPLLDIVDEIRTTPGGAGAGVALLFPESVQEVDASGAAATGGTPVPNLATAIPGDDGGERLPLGEVTELPSDNRLDFFYERCDFAPDCYRDAVFVDNDDPSLGSAGWEAGRPFIVRHGFINSSEEPLDDAFDVVVYSYEMNWETRGPTIRYTSDYVVRGRTSQCGPTYRTVTGPVTCEWFVHEFPEGLPAGRHALWAVWQAPCWAWIDYGFVDACADPDEVMALFGSGVDSPWDERPVIWEPR